VPGVGRVSLVGQRDYAVRIWLDPDRLTAYRLTVKDVQEALRKAKVEVEVGRGTRGKEPPSFIVSPGQLRAPEKLTNLVLSKGSGSPVHLHDVARLELGARDAESSASLDGKPAVAVVVDVAPMARPREVSAALKQTLQKLGKRFPKGISAGALFDFAPNREALDRSDTPDYLLTAISPPEGTSPEQAARAVQRCAELLRKTRGVQRVLCLSGGELFESCRDRPCVLAALAPAGKGRDSKEQILTEARRQLGEVPGIRVNVRPLSAGGLPLGASPVALAVSGPDPARVKQVALKLAERLQRSTSVTDLWGSALARRKRILVEVDRTRAATLGVSLSDVVLTVETYLGRVRADDLKPRARTWRLHAPGHLADRAKDLRQLQVRNSKAEMVPLGALVSLSAGQRAAAVYRLDGQPAEKITADLPPKVSLQAARQLCEKEAEAVRKDMRLPPAYRITWLGQAGQ